MKRKAFLKELIAYSKENNMQFVGTGNPEAKILIIGKECAIDRTSKDEKGNPVGEWQYQREIAENIVQWEGWLNDAPLCYSPKFPYKGQLTKPNNGNNNGTSRTWCNYQKLKNADSKVIDFHDDFFLTELSVIAMPKSKGKNFEPTKQSIIQRLKMIKDSHFFQSFDTVILACADYITEDQICDVFGVNIAGADLEPYQWHSWYYSSDNSKLVIHTRQLSNYVSGGLLEKITEKIKPLLQSGACEVGDLE